MKEIEISVNAAKLRAKYSIRTPDALQIATAAKIEAIVKEAKVKHSVVKVLSLSA